MCSICYPPLPPGTITTNTANVTAALPLDEDDVERQCSNPYGHHGHRWGLLKTMICKGV